MFDYWRVEPIVSTWKIPYKIFYHQSHWKWNPIQNPINTHGTPWKIMFTKLENHWKTIKIHKNPLKSFSFVPFFGWTFHKAAPGRGLSSLRVVDPDLCSATSLPWSGRIKTRVGRNTPGVRPFTPGSEPELDNSFSEQVYILYKII